MENATSKDVHIVKKTSLRFAKLVLREWNSFKENVFVPMKDLNTILTESVSNVQSMDVCHARLVSLVCALGVWIATAHILEQTANVYA